MFLLIGIIAGEPPEAICALGGLLFFPCGWGSSPLVAGAGGIAAGRRAGFVFAAVQPHDSFPHAMGRVAPAGAGVTFRRRKVTKRRHGAAPPGTPAGQGQCTRQSRSSREGFVPTARSRIKRGFFLFGFAVLFRFFALVPVANPAGGWRGHVGGLSPPTRCARA